MKVILNLIKSSGVLPVMISSDKSNLYLIGFSGSGKTSVGRELADMTGAHLFDTDKRIEEREHRSIKRIFAEEGEDYFRCIESEVVKEAANLKRAIVAVGGGSHLLEINRDLIRKTGFVVCLTASAETIERRLASSEEERPLLTDGTGKSIKDLMSERKETYSMADECVDTDRYNAKEVAKLTLVLMQRKGLLCEAKIQNDHQI